MDGIHTVVVVGLGVFGVKYLVGRKLRIGIRRVAELVLYSCGAWRKPC